MSALKSRWFEDAGVAHEEMRRAVRFFKHFEDRWLQMGKKFEESGLDGRAAYARKYARLHRSYANAS